MSKRSLYVGAPLGLGANACQATARGLGAHAVRAGSRTDWWRLLGRPGGDWERLERARRRARRQVHVDRHGACAARARGEKKPAVCGLKMMRESSGDSGDVSPYA
jgi:hypothetical protein